MIDVSQIPDERLKQQVWLGILELCMKHIFARDILPHLQDMLDLFKQVEQAGGGTYIQTALTYLLTAGEVSHKKAFFETIQQQLSPETGASIMTLAQQLQAEGMEKGRLEGNLEAKKAIAQKLLKQGLSLEAISQITELSLQEIQALGKSSTSSH